MPAWLTEIVAFFKDFSGLLSFALFLGYVSLQVYKHRQEAKLEKERVNNEKALQKELHELRTQLERKAILDNELRKDLAECWKTQADALRKKLALIFTPPGQANQTMLQELLHARTKMRQRFYDSLYLPQALIQMMRNFDDLLRDPTVVPQRLYAENATFREAMRVAAGLVFDADAPAKGEAEVEADVVKPGKARRKVEPAREPVPPIPAPAAPERGHTLVDDDVKDLLLDAVTQATAASGEGFVRMAALKPAMRKLDPTFDEAAYEFPTFSAFVAACADVVAVVQGPHDKHVLVAPHTRRRERAAEPAPEADNPKVEYFRKILRRQQYRLMPAGQLLPLCRAACEAAKERPFATFDDFYERVRASSPADLRAKLTDADLVRFKQLLFKNHLLDLRGEHGIFLEQGVATPEAMVELVFRNTIRRLDSQPDLKWDADGVSRLLYGDGAHAAQVNKWYAEFKTAGTEASAPAGTM